MRSENWREGYAGTRPLKGPWSKRKIAGGRRWESAADRQCD